MQHERFDLAHWMRVFPESDYLKTEDWSPGPGQGLCGPREACLLEYHRQKLREEGFDFGPAVPADLFVFAKGEPANRAVTKLGGLPYRPRGLPWPRARHFSLEAVLDPSATFTPSEWAEVVREEADIAAYLDEEWPACRFLGQFNFADSRDLVGELPGDVLLLFGSYEHPFIYHYEWHPLGLTDLIPAEDMPTTFCDPQDEYVTCCGQIHRIWDYPQGAERHPQFRQRFGAPFWEAIFCPKAHRIGGRPYFVQNDIFDDPVICVVDGVTAQSGKTWPWVNVREPIPRYDLDADEDGEAWQRHHAQTQAILDCSGSIYLSLDKAGQLRWEDQCT